MLKLIQRQVGVLNEQENRQQRYLEHIKAFRLIDDDFMTKCFEDNIECVELLLRIILGKEDLQVSEAKTQVFVLNLKNRSVRLDVLATDSNGCKYNIEIQRENKGAGYKRARYYSSMVDVNMLQKSQDFDNLPETYIIFITENDVIGKGLPIYEIERQIVQTGEIIDDGEHILYINGARQDDTALGKLMQDMVNPEPATMNYDVLAKTVDYYKNSKEGNAVMCKAMEDLWNEAMQQGMQQGIDKGLNEARKANALRMLTNGKLTLEEVAECSGLTLEEVKKLQSEKSA